MKQWNIEIKKVLKYFSIFAYNPTLEQIHTFLQAKITKDSLEKELMRLIKDKKLLASKHTPPQYSIPTSPRQHGASKYKISKRKLGNWRFRVYVRLLSIFPQIQLVGLSGSISMMNAKEDDDIDLFIITARNRLFTGRLVSLFLAQLLGLRRSRNAWSSKNKVCLNLFFDEGNLKVPIIKQTEFVGHEVLQMKPIVNKLSVYERFLMANLWVFELFPNCKSKIHRSNVKINPKSKDQKFGFMIFSLICHSDFVIWISNKIEYFLKNLQLTSINRHRTTETITSTQLWFHPDDFEKKLPGLDKKHLL